MFAKIQYNIIGISFNAYWALATMLQGIYKIKQSSFVQPASSSRHHANEILITFGIESKMHIEWHHKLVKCIILLHAELNNLKPACSFMYTFHLTETSFHHYKTCTAIKQATCKLSVADHLPTASNKPQWSSKHNTLQKKLMEKFLNEIAKAWKHNLPPKINTFLWSRLLPPVFQWQHTPLTEIPN